MYLPIFSYLKKIIDASLNPKAPNFQNRTVAASDTCDKPAGTTTGDFLLAICSIEWDGSHDVSPPDANWIPIISSKATLTSGHQVASFYKWATGSEPSSYTFTNAHHTNIIRYRNVDTVSPITGAVANKADTWSAPGPRTNPGFTTDAASALIYASVSSDGITYNPGRWGRNIGFGSYNQSSMFFSTQNTSGVVGAISSSDAEVGVWVNICFGLRGASGSKTAPTPLYVQPYEDSGSHTYDKPTWQLPRDIIIAVWNSKWYDVVVPPGFDLIASVASNSVFMKIIGESEPSSYTFSHLNAGGGSKLYGAVLTFSGIDIADPFSGTIVLESGYGSPDRPTTGVTTDTDESLVYTIAFGGTGPTFRTDRVAEFLYGTGAGYAKALQTAGASGSDNYTMAGPAGWSLITIPFKPIP